MMTAGNEEDLRLLQNVTARSLALVNNELASPNVTAFEYTGKVWPHWATFQHYLPGGKHILHPDTDKGEHCISLAVSFSTHGKDFSGGEIKIFECPTSVPDCGNRGRARTHVPSEGGPYGRRLANGSLVPLVNGEWLWDGEPEAAYKVTQELHPKSGTAIVWLSETVHQVEPVSAGTRKSLFYWFTCKEPLQDAAFDWSGLAHRYGAAPVSAKTVAPTRRSEKLDKCGILAQPGTEELEEENQAWPKKKLRGSQTVSLGSVNSGVQVEEEPEVQILGPGWRKLRAKYGGVAMMDQLLQQVRASNTQQMYDDDWTHAMASSADGRHSPRSPKPGYRECDDLFMARHRPAKACCPYRSLVGILLACILVAFLVGSPAIAPDNVVQATQTQGIVATDLPGFAEPPTSPSLKCVKFVFQGMPHKTAALTPSPEPTTKYGFYLHVHGHPAAVIYQVREVKKWFPGSPIHVMSDGNMDFSALCALENCSFVLCPPANDRWHPWPFLRRLYDAAVILKSEFVILLEPDNTIHGPIKTTPEFDAGGLRVKERSFAGAEYVQRLAKERRPGFRWTRENQEAGLCGGSYYRTAAVLDAFSDENVAKIDWNMLGEKFSKD
eukprot:symbB.v1.2.018936.t1/scaffold1487.1/size223630/6